MKRNLSDDMKNLGPILLPAGYFITSIGFWKIGKSDGNMGIIIVVIGLVFVLCGIVGISHVHSKEVARIDADKKASVEWHDEVLKALEKQAKEFSDLRDDFRAMGQQIKELKSDINNKNNHEV